MLSMTTGAGVNRPRPGQQHTVMLGVGISLTIDGLQFDTQGMEGAVSRVARGNEALNSISVC